MSLTKTSKIRDKTVSNPDIVTSIFDAKAISNTILLALFFTFLVTCSTLSRFYLENVLNNLPT